jgi:hypothetical protein
MCLMLAATNEAQHRSCVQSIQLDEIGPEGLDLRETAKTQTRRFRNYQKFLFMNTPHN